MFSLIWEIGIGKFIETESRIEVTRGWEGEELGGRWGMRSYCLIDTEFLFQVTKLLEIDSGGGCTIV